MAYSLGIDLGTTLSAAATARDGLIEIVQLGEQDVHDAVDRRRPSGRRGARR